MSPDREWVQWNNSTLYVHVSSTLVCRHNWDHVEAQSNYCQIKSIRVIIVAAHRAARFPEAVEIQKEKREIEKKKKNSVVAPLATLHCSCSRCFTSALNDCGHNCNVQESLSAKRAQQQLVLPKLRADLHLKHILSILHVWSYLQRIDLCCLLHLNLMRMNAKIQCALNYA